MDSIDRQLVASLIDDGRASFRELGEQVGLSAPAVKRRVDRLFEDGVISRIGAQLDPAAVGRSTGAFVELFCEGRVPPERLRVALTKIPEVVAAYTVTGDADAVVFLAVEDTHHLERTLEQIRAEAFVTKTRSTVVLTRLVERGGAPLTSPGSTVGPPGVTDG